VNTCHLSASETVLTPKLPKTLTFSLYIKVYDKIIIDLDASSCNNRGYCLYCIEYTTLFNKCVKFSSINISGLDEHGPISSFKLFSPIVMQLNNSIGA
jgi:hypothetical protein